MHRLALTTLFVLGACTVTATTPPPAQPGPPPPVVTQPVPDQYPGYLNALADLRGARAYLTRPGNTMSRWDESRAIREIDAAMHEIRQAAIDDGKDVNDHPPIDRPTWGGRLERAAELLGRAHNEVGQEADSPAGRVRGLRDRAMQHIANAERLVREGIDDARADAPPPPPPPPPPAPPAQHPAYLHALGDLRTARAMLARPARDADVSWDEQRAIRHIDAAIHNITEAAINDGKPIDDHPPLDMGVRYRGRIRTAIEMLERAAADIEQREDSSFGRGLRGRAVGHIRDAVKYAREAIEDRRR